MSSLLAVGYSGGLGSPCRPSRCRRFSTRRHTAAQRAQARTADPAAAGAGAGAPAGPRAAARQRAAPGVGARARPSRARQAGRGRRRGAGRAGGRHARWPGPAGSRPPGAFRAIPQYWHDAAAWLDEHNAGGPTPGRVLVAPGAPFATQVWGTSHDEPLQVLGDSPWGVRDSIPLTPPADDPRAGLRAAAVRRGPAVRRAGRYPCPAGDLLSGGAQRPRSRHVAVGAAAAGPPRDRRFTRADQGGRVRRAGGPGHADRVSSPTAGCGRSTRRCEIYRVDAGSATVPTGAPYLADTDAMARVDGGPEALLRLDERRRLLGQPPLGPVLLTADAQRAGLADPGRHRHRHPAGPRNRLRPRRRPLVGDPRPRRTAAHLQPGARLPGRRRPHRCTAAGPAAGSRCRVRRRTPPRCRNVSPGDRPGRGHRRRPLDQLGVQRAAVRGRPVAAGGFRPSGHQRHDHHHTERHGRRRPGPPDRDRHRQRHQHAALRRARQAADRRRCPTARRRGCGITAVGTDDGSPGVQFGITDFAVTQYDANGFAHPVELRHTVVGARPASRVRLSPNGIWVRSCSAAPAAPTGPTACAARRRWRCRPRSRST